MNQVDPSEKHPSERATSFLTVVSSLCCSTHASVSTWTLVPSLPRFHLAVRELCSQVGRGLHAATVRFLFSSSPRTSSIVKGPPQGLTAVLAASGENNNIANGPTTKPAGAYCGTTHFWPACDRLPSSLLSFCIVAVERLKFHSGPRNDKGLNQKV